MCFTCGDADKKIRARPSTSCTGEQHPYLTLDQLKSDLIQENIKTGKRDFRIFRGIIIGNYSKTLSFDIQYTYDSSQTINIIFI